MRSENSKTSKPHVLVLDFTDKIDLSRGLKIHCFIKSQYYYTWKNIKPLYNYNKLKISAIKWNHEFELPDGSYSVPAIQNYFEYILKQNEGNFDNSSIKACINKIEKRITFKTKTEYFSRLLTPEAMKLFESTNSKITKYKNGENMSHLQITEVILVHYNIV